MVVEPHPLIEVSQPVSKAARLRHHPAKWTLAAGFAVVATIVGLIVLAWAVLFVTKGRFLKPGFESVASRMSGRDIRVAGDFQFYFDIIKARFVADGLTVSNPTWASRPNFFEARHIAARIDTIAVLFGKRKADWLVLDGGKVDAEWNRQKQNSWTFGDPDAKGEPFQWPIIASATVTNTEVRYVDPQLFLRADIKVGDIAGGNRRIEGKVPFTGAGTLRGRPFTLYGSLLSPNSTLGFGRTRFEMHARSGPTFMDVDGVLPAATRIEGSDLNLKVRGPNIRTLFDFLGVAAPDTRAYWFTSKLTRAGVEWRFTRINGRYGASDLHGRMTLTFPKDRLFLDATLDSNLVDIIDVGPFIGYGPQALASRGAQAAVRQIGATPRIFPDAPLRTDSIRNFDAHILYTVKDFRNPKFPITNVNLTFNLDNSLMTLSPLTFDIAGGKLASDISIDARVPAVITDYDIRLSTTPLGKLLAQFGVEQAGTTGSVKARIRMKGTGNTLRDSLATSNGRIAIILPKGSFWTQYVQLAEFDVGLFVQKLIQDKLKKPIEINCGVLGFTVRDGVAAADPILIDTDKNVMTAKGGFSFKDESLDMNFRADAKKFSLFSGQSPVGINGYFAAPKLDLISKQLITRAGAGVALGVVGSPLAALIAFVDVGDAKSAACGPVLAGAQASAMRTKSGKPRKDVGKVRENRQQAGDRKQPESLDEKIGLKK